MKTAWKSPAAITLAASLSLSWLVWQGARAPAGAPPAAPVKVARKSPARASAAPGLPAEESASPSQLDDLRALALTQADAARARAARMGEEAAVAIAVTLAGTDLEATEAWARTLGDPLHDAVFTALAVEVSRLDPVTALRLGNQLKAEVLRQQMLGHALAQLAATDPRAAWATLSGTTSPDDSSATTSIVLAAVADHDPLAVAKWIARDDTPTELMNSLAIPVAQRWAQQEPEAAAAWVAAFGAGPLRQQAAEALMQVWISRDAVGAAAWVDRGPSADARDDMAAGLGAALVSRDTQAARSLVSSIKNESLRTQLLARIETQSPPAPSGDQDHIAAPPFDCNN